MRRKTLVQGGLALAVAGLVIAFALMWRPAIAPLPKAVVGHDAESIRRGARVVEQGDCAVCHTRPGGAYMAGGLPLVTPFGTLYTTNITPDPASGIGLWPEEAFIRAMRNGIARDGHLLYPAFPYVHYSRMSERDIRDAYAFLMSVDPVEAHAPPNQMMFPMNFRPLVAFWNLLFLHGAPLQDVAGQSTQWNRGRYLVEGAGHCSSCHSPLNFIGGEKGSELFNGGVVDGWDAPSLRGLGEGAHPWNAEQLQAYLRGEVAEGHGAAAGPMLPVSLSLAQLPSADVQAIADYILSLKPDADKSRAAPCALAQPAVAVASEGATLFAGACAGCHGPAAPMRMVDGRPGLEQSSALRADSPRNLIKTVLDGIPLSRGDASHYMPAFANSLNDSQIAAIAGYLREQTCSARPWADLDKTISSLRQEGHAK
jgi:mono/diheme cytochrome c family protein